MSCVQLLSQSNVVTHPVSSSSSSSYTDTSSLVVNTSSSSVNGKLPIARLVTSSQTQKPARTLAKLLPQTSNITSNVSHSPPQPASASSASSSSSSSSPAAASAAAGTAVLVSEWPSYNLNILRFLIRLYLKLDHKSGINSQLTDIILYDLC